MKVLLCISSLLFFFTCCLSVSSQAFADPLPSDNEANASAIPLEAIEVGGQGGHVLFGKKQDMPNTETSLTRDGIEALSGAAQGNPLQAIRTLPSVQVSSEEPYGFGGFFTSGVKIRGQRIKAPGSNLLVEGLQVTGTPGGSQYLFDLENVERLSLYKGGIPVPKGLAFANSAGLLDYRLRRPDEEAGAYFEQSVGSFDYQRSFIRLDTGRLPDGTRSFASYSYTDADKWRGEGGSPDWRHNVDFGLSRDFGNRVKLELFGNYFSVKAHDFRSLTYDQVKHLGTYHKADFNSQLTGVASEDIYYYDYNRRQFEGYTLMADLELRLTEHSRFSVRPYYSRDQGYWLYGLPGNGSPVIRKWEIDHHRLGVVAQYEVELRVVDVTAGYWYHEQERPGAPTEWKKYQLTADGLEFNGYFGSVLNDNSKHITHSPFLQLNRKFGRLQLSGGVRYHYQEFADIKAYSYAVATGEKTYDPEASIGRKYNDKVLPFAGISFDLSDHSNVYVTYGRNVGRVAFPAYPFYATHKPAFVANGITLRDLWHNVKLEVSDHYDLGGRLDFGRWYLNPVLFYSRHFDKAVNYLEPTSGQLVNQNVATARSYGAELEMGVHIMDNLLLAANGYYNNFEFEKNFEGLATGELDVKGNQIADTPLFGASILANYRLGGLSVTPVVRYTGRRYGDVLNEEALRSYWVADLNLGYHLKDLWCFKEAELKLNFINLFDKKYIGAMDASDDTHPGQMSYYPGAPFTAVFSVGLRL